ncbi:hypothetical protein [Pseudomonas extremorientalis]|jgi:hypothetical protein|nr:hypothetical protein [Pseudomonas extremorientalis]WLG58888.1 hypothetical protein PSH77_10315 [Pseudomonas extremorientalis]SDP88128.1 hypothetical protein SAMN04490184_5525 [Pseudomonas extremorientalis]
MSVSPYNHSVAPNLDNASPGEETRSSERSAITSRALVSAGIHFASQSSHCGPVFGGPPPRPLPENVRPNPGPPPRPNPALPDPYLSKQSNEQLAQALLNSYDAFRGRWPSRSVTRKSVQKMANQPLTGDPAKDANIRLAKELLRRPGLLQALDRNGSTGELNGRLSKDDIKSFIQSDNPLKSKDDKQLVQEMLNHFNELKGGYFSSTIKLRDLHARAMQPLTGNSRNDHLTLLAREVMARSNLMATMDNVESWRRDGKISRQELNALLR